MKPIRPSQLLIVDDEPAILAVLKLALASLRGQIETAATAEEALPLLLRTRYDLLLLDKNLPGMSGIELARQARRILPDARIVLMTGYGSSASAVTALNVGVDEYLEKPFRNIFAVTALIKRLLERPDTAKGAPVEDKLRVAILAPSIRVRARMALELDSGRDDLILVGMAEELKEERIDVLLLDGSAYGDRCPAIIRSLRDASRHSIKVVVVAQRLALPVVKQLIQLGVTTFIDAAADSEAASARTRDAIDQFRSIQRSAR